MNVKYFNSLDKLSQIMDEVLINHIICFCLFLFFPGISLFDDLENFQLAQLNKKE